MTPNYNHRLGEEQGTCAEHGGRVSVRSTLLVKYFSILIKFRGLGQKNWKEI